VPRKRTNWITRGTSPCVYGSLFELLPFSASQNSFRPNFLKYTNAGDPREIEVGVRFQF
jgi:hypothetical protein